MKRILAGLVACSGFISLNVQAACLTTAQAQSQINTKYNANASLLGSPVGSLQVIGTIGDFLLTSGWRQNYTKENQAAILISECGGTGAHIVQGFIRIHFDAIGGTKVMGFPKTDEQPYAGGRVSNFEHGKIIYKTGATWDKGTFPVLYRSYWSDRLVAASKQKSQTGGTVTVYAQKLKPNTMASLYVNSLSGQRLVKNSMTNANGYVNFGDIWISNTEAYGDAQGYTATLEVNDGNSHLGVSGVVISGN